jgi:hypothetical protein
MLTLTRDTKRLTIVVVYLLVFFAIGAGTFVAMRPAATCFDGVRNQDEVEVDCGGICALACVEHIVGNDLVIRELTFIPSDRGKYDVIARIFNPNNDVGAASFQYSLILKDAADVELGRVTNSGFILPQETKTLLAFNLESDKRPAKAVIEMSDFVWQRIQEYRAKPELNLYSKRYVERPDPSVFGAVTGTLINESIYDFRSIQIKVILRDAAGLPLAVNQTVMQTVMVGRERDVRIVFPAAFSGTVAQVEMETEANIYDNENFLQEYNLVKPAVPTSGSAEPSGL